jgi:hypothetical protein
MEAKRPRSGETRKTSVETLDGKFIGLVSTNSLTKE